MKIHSIDLASQHLKLKREMDHAIQSVIQTSDFIQGAAVKEFANQLACYQSMKHVIPVANGTDALQIALMALDLKEGDEVIVPDLTYGASAEAIALLKLTPVFIEVDPLTYTITAEHVQHAITAKTKVIMPVHLYGQCCEMEPILLLAAKYDLYVIEDTAQALGATYTFADGTVHKAGTMGDIGCTSFFPTKNLGCMGDGGAVFTNDDQLAERIRLISTHGQSKKYHHLILGCNSRLDTIQAAVLKVKLPHLDSFNAAKQAIAQNYTNAFSRLGEVATPSLVSNSTHTYHQYTIRVEAAKRDLLKAFLAQQGVPSTVYYPVPMHQQEAFKFVSRQGEVLKSSILLCSEILSLPIHTELDEASQAYVIQTVSNFFL